MLLSPLFFLYPITPHPTHEGSRLSQCEDAISPEIKRVVILLGVIFPLYVARLPIICSSLILSSDSSGSFCRFPSFSIQLTKFSAVHRRCRESAAYAATVAPSGQPHSLSRRKSAAASASESSHSPSASSSSPSRSQISKPTRIVYREASVSETDLPFWQRTWFIAGLFVMALGFFGFAIFLFVSLDADISASPVSAATSEGVEITYGSTIKLMHEKTKFRLHSHEVPYGSGSGQQSVTGFPTGDDANSYWVVKPIPEALEKQGDAIKSGTVVRLQHMRTRRWLHSHLHASPISGNLEVSCFGGDTQSDTGDHWRIHIEGSGKTWRQDQRVRLQHVDTGGYLHSHNKKYARIAGGQQEVCGVREKRADNIWLAAEGVYLPVTEGKTATASS